jgi:SAP domain-containing ribonucleoprotein
MPVNTTELKKLKVTELRDQLSSRGLDTKGVKDELIARLAAAMEVEEGAAPPAAASAPVTAAAAPVPEAAPAADAPVAPVTAAAAPPSAAPAPVAAPSAAEILASGKPILAEVDKRKMRAERFGGVVSPADAAAAKKAAASATAIGGLGHFDPTEEFERRKKRAERFGLPIPVSKAEESLKKKARADRFGIEDPVSAAEKAEAAKKARAERFAATGGAAPGSAKAKAVELTAEEKKKLEDRAKRFAPVAQS